MKGTYVSPYDGTTWTALLPLPDAVPDTLAKELPLAMSRSPSPAGLEREESQPLEKDVKALSGGNITPSPPLSPHDPYSRNAGSPTSLPTPSSEYHFTLHNSWTHRPDYTSSGTGETPGTDHSASTPPISAASVFDLMSLQSAANPSDGGYQCTVPGCNAAPFQTQYLLNAHANVHSSARPHYCPVPGCPRGETGKGFRRKNEMIRHGLVHDSPGYVCPFCPDPEHKYPRPDNLQRHVRVHHVDKSRDDPLLRAVLSQRFPRPRRGIARHRPKTSQPATTVRSTSHAQHYEVGSISTEETLPTPAYPPLSMVVLPHTARLTPFKEVVMEALGPENKGIVLSPDGDNDSESRGGNGQPSRQLIKPDTGHYVSLTSIHPSPTIFTFACPYFLEVSYNSPCIGNRFKDIYQLTEHLHQTHGFEVCQASSLKEGHQEKCPLSQWVEIYCTLFNIDPDRDKVPLPYQEGRGKSAYLKDMANQCTDQTCREHSRRHLRSSSTEAPRRQVRTGPGAGWACCRCYELSNTQSNDECSSCSHQQCSICLILDTPKGYSPTPIITPEIVELREVGAWDILSDPENTLEEYVLQEDTYRWRCKLPGCSKLFQGERAWREHVKGRHVDRMDIIRKWFDPQKELYGLDSVKTAEDDSRKPMEVASCPAPEFESVNQPQFAPPGSHEDEIFTDSGYSSLPPSNINRQCEKTRGHVAEALLQTMEDLTEPTDDDGAKTEFSAAPTVNAQSIQESINWVCDDIHFKLKNSLGLARMPALANGLANSLAETVKAFALTFGAESTNPMSLQIMRFVYKHHDEIVSALNQRFEAKQGVEPEPQREKSPEMSVLEKMDLWGSATQLADFGPDAQAMNEIWQSDPGSSPESYDEEIDSEADEKIIELPIYSKMITESRAYQRLLDTISKQSRLSWNNTEPNIMIEEIRRLLLRRLPKGRISRIQLPPTFTVCMRMPRRPLLERMEQERFRWNPMLSLPLLGDVMTLIGSCRGEFQALTVRDYFMQTWSDDELSLLEEIQALLNNGTAINTNPVTEAEPMPLKLRMTPEYLEATISGSADYIATCGEQLAWLTSALQPFDAALMESKPRIEESGSLEFTLSSEVAIPHHETNTLPKDLLQVLQRRLPAPCTVLGFPTACRPEGFTGLEIPWFNLLHLVHRSQLDLPSGKTGDHRLLRGTAATLDLVKVVEGTAMWHLVDQHNASNGCPRRCFGSNNPQIVGNITFEELAMHRHVISGCNPNMTDLEEQAVVAAMDSTLQMVPGAALCRKHASDEVDFKLLGEALADESPRSVSIDSEMVSYSGCSRASDTGDGVEIDIGCSQPLVETIKDRLILGFRNRSHRSPYAVDGDDAGNHTAEEPPSSSFPSQPVQTSSGNSKKRKLGRSDDGGRDEDGSMLPPTKKARLKQEILLPDVFACPYWKLNPGRYHACFPLDLRTVSRVKQHLNRRHAPRFYCHRCWSTFEKAELHSTHMMRESVDMCAPNPSATLDGLLHEQRDRLSRKCQHPNMSERDKWFTVWDIVFPRTQRPSSPYRNNQLSEDCASFQEYALRHGPDVLLQELESRGGATSTGVSEAVQGQILRRAIAEGLASLIETWTRPDSGPVVGPPENLPLGTLSESIDNSTGPGQSPGSSLPDSGVMLSSNSSDARLRQPRHQPAESIIWEDEDERNIPSLPAIQQLAGESSRTLSNPDLVQPQVIGDRLQSYNFHDGLQPLQDTASANPLVFDEMDAFDWNIPGEMHQIDHEDMVEWHNNFTIFD